MIKMEVKDKSAVIKTGAVDKYFKKLFIKRKKRKVWLKPPLN